MKISRIAVFQNKYWLSIFDQAALNFRHVIYHNFPIVIHTRGSLPAHLFRLA